MGRFDADTSVVVLDPPGEAHSADFCAAGLPSRRGVCRLLKLNTVVYLVLLVSEHECKFHGYAPDV